MYLAVMTPLCRGKAINQKRNYFRFSKNKVKTENQGGKTMKNLKHLFTISLIAMLMSVTGISSVSASAAVAWNTSKPKMDISVQSNAQNRTFAIKVYNKSGAKYYKVLER